MATDEGVSKTMDKPSHVLDLVVGGRLMSACWFLASLGCAILHMRLLAQAWHQSGTALEAAVVSSAWLVGTVISAQRRTAAAGNGLLFVTVVLLWLASPAVSWSIAPALHVLATYVGLCVCSFILGFTSTSWLTRPRRFPPVGEQVLLCRGLVGSTVGLVIVWLLPGSVFSAVCGLIVLVPLLLLDVLPQSRSPLPATGGLVERWSAQVVPSTAGRRTGLTLETGALPRGWWISYLAARGQLGLTEHAKQRPPHARRLRVRPCPINRLLPMGIVFELVCQCHVRRFFYPLPNDESEGSATMRIGPHISQHARTKCLQGPPRCNDHCRSFSRGGP